MPVRRYRFILFAGIATLALLAAGARPAFAQTKPDTVVLSPVRGLDFGSFVASTGGTIVVTPAGLRSRTGGVILLNSPNVGQAAYNVSRTTNGTNKNDANITLPANGTIRLTSGANSMAVGSFVSSPVSTMVIPAGGTTLTIGATLTVAPNQAPGTYTGTFPVTVNYP